MHNQKRAICKYILSQIILGVLAMGTVCRAQEGVITDSVSVPMPGVGHDYLGELSETVNPATGSVSVRLPIPTPPGRKLTVPLFIAYDSSSVYRVNSMTYYTGQFSSVIRYTYGLTSDSFTKGGWTYTLPLLTWSNLVRSTFDSKHLPCNFTSGYVLRAPNGSQNALQAAKVFLPTSQGCVQQFMTSKSDGDSVYTVTPLSDGTPQYVVGPDGTSYQFPANACLVGGNGGYESMALASSVEDRNGNIVQFSPACDPVTNARKFPVTMTDTAGRTAISISGFGNTGDTVSSSGLSSPFTLSWSGQSASFSLGVITSGNASLADSFTGTVPAITNVTTPNGHSYVLAYDSTYGLLKKITFPSGGYVRYQWGLSNVTNSYSYPTTTAIVSNSFTYNVPAISDRYVSFDGVTEVLHQHFSYTQVPGVTDYKRTAVTTTDSSSGTPVTFETDYSYNALTPPTPPYIPGNTGPISLEHTIVQKNSSGSVLRTTTEGWRDQFHLASKQIQLDSGQTSQVIYQWDGDYLTEKDEYDFGSSSPNRRTLTTYQQFSGARGPLSTVFKLPCSTLIKDALGTVVGETDIAYDNASTPCASSSATVAAVSGLVTGTHDETSYNESQGTPRGNATTVSRKCLNGCSDSMTKYTYDKTGQILSKVDPCGSVTCNDVVGSNHTTAYSYSDNFATGLPAGQTNAYLTSITLPNTGAAHVQTFAWNYASGTLSSSTDENAKTTSYQYDDPLLRITQESRPDGGTTVYSYNDASFSSSGNTPNTTVSTSVTSTNSLARTTAFDGMLHPVKTLTTDPISTVYTIKLYDGLGRVSASYNPTRCSPPTANCGESTWGFTRYLYDPLDRLTNTTRQDGSAVAVTFSGNTTTTIDEAGRKRSARTDAFGRLTAVWEDPGGLNYETDYQYDALDNLIGVTQSGLQPRSYGYDSLSRMKSASNPESGTTTYTYDASGNVATKTDARNVTTTYSYDVLNRFLQKSYSDTNPTYANGTPTVSYVYDQSNATVGSTAVTLANSIGRLSSEATLDQNGNATTKSAFTYDTGGHIGGIWSCQDVGCTTPVLWVSYGYDLAGNEVDRNLGGVDYASDYNSAGQLTSFHQTSFGNNNWISGVTYDPAGRVSSATFDNGLSQVWNYDNRGRLASISVGTSCSGGSCTGSRYSLSVGYSGNSEVTSANDSVNGNWTYGYDALNRLATSSCSLACPNGTGSQSFSYSYDRFGNRTQQVVTSGSGPNVFLTFSGGTNRIDGYSYDAAGNLLNDGSHSYAYDAEARIKSVDNGATTYFYDAEGRRLERIVAGVRSDYFYGRDGISLIDIQQGAPLYQEIYAGGLHIATKLLNSGHTGTNAYFHHNDWLGTERVRTDANGNICESITSLAFGDAQSITGSCGDVSLRHFTGKERDTETGLDYFGARYFGSTLGRWVSPDPSNLGVDFHLPQTLNRYAYSLNSPLSIVDRNGLWPYYIHERIIDESFPGLSKSDLNALKHASWKMDFDEGQQDPANSFQHGMSNGLTNEDPAIAQQNGDNFISEQIETAQEAQADWESSGHSGISPAALTAFGNALHTATDRTSPSHAGNQPWHNDPWYSKRTRAHVEREATSTSAQRDAARDIARALFRRTFGEEFNWVFVNPKKLKACVTAAGETTCN